MLKLYKKYLKYYKKEVVLGPLFKLLEAIFELFVPIVIAQMINKGFINHDFNYILKMFIVLIILAITGLSSTLVCQYFASRASQGVGTRLRSDVYEKTTNLTKSNFDHFGVPRLVSIINNDIKNVEFSVAMLIRLVIRAPFIVVGAVVMAFILNINYGLILLVTSIILLSSILFIMLKTIPHNKKSLNKLDNISQLFKEDIGGAYLIRTNSSYKLEETKMQNKLDDLYKQNKHVAFLQALMSPLALLIVNVTIIVAIIFSYNLINKAAILPGDIIAFISYLNQILVASQVVCNLIITFGKAISSADRINELMDFDNKSNFNDNNIIENNSFLEVKNLSYRFYTDSDLVIDDVSFTLNEGEFVTLVGQTGSGKSTLLNLISNLIKKEDGFIYFKGKEITNYNKEDLYKEISYVLQKNSIINASLKDNIIFGSNNHDINNSIKLSKTDVIVNKKDSKLDEMVYDKGANLSGGEKKRVMLARALNKRPQILLIDQGLAGLDNITLKEVITNIRSLNITTIVITDNKSVIKESDRILVLLNGKLVGNDVYDNLINNNEIFKDLMGVDYE